MGLDFARRGLRHDAGDADVMAACGLTPLQVGKEYDLGMAVLRAALKANPNSLTVVTFCGIGLLHCGSIDEARECLLRTIRLILRDPFAHVSLCGIAQAHLMCRDYVAARDWAIQALAGSASWSPTYWMLIAAEAHLGETGAAPQHLHHLLALGPGVTISAIWAGQPAYDPARMAPVFEGLRLAGMAD